MKPTLNDVAKKAGVSRATASMALRKHPKSRSFSAATLQRVASAAKDLGYRTNFFASQLRRKTAQFLMVYLHTMQDLYSSGVAEHLQERAAQRGYWTLVNVCPAGWKGKAFDERIVGGHGISAVAIISAMVDRVPRHSLRRLVREGVHVTIIGRDVEEQGVSRVLVDDYRGGWLAAEHIYGLGARRVWMMVSGKVQNISRHRRYKAVLDYAEQHSLPAPIVMETIASVSPSGLPDPMDIDEAAYNVLRDRLAKADARPEAIIANLDLRGLGAYRALFESGYEPGRDVAVIGYDDIWPSRVAHPMMTTIHQPVAEIGKAGADMLIDSLEETIHPGRTITLSPQLLVRDSTRLWKPRQKG